MHHAKVDDGDITSLKNAGGRRLVLPGVPYDKFLRDLDRPMTLEQAKLLQSDPRWAGSQYCKDS